MQTSSSPLGFSIKPEKPATYSGEYGKFTDERDGNVYRTVDIDGTVWFADNLKYEVPNALSFCNCADTTSCDSRGRLYPWDVAKNACPAGWRLPSDKTVTIGSQTWMAENLNYETANSFCYEDNVSNCTKYGRLYTWAAAMDSAGVYSENSKDCGYGHYCRVNSPARGICPEGWHVPTWAEWYTLYSAIGSTPYAMQAKGFDNWPDATDAYGFSALPAGHCYQGFCYGVGKSSSFWSASEGSSEGAYEWILGADEADFSIGHGSEKICSFSVRCVKD